MSSDGFAVSEPMRGFLLRFVVLSYFDSVRPTAAQEKRQDVSRKTTRTPGALGVYAGGESDGNNGVGCLQGSHADSVHGKTW